MPRWCLSFSFQCLALVSLTFTTPPARAEWTALSELQRQNAVVTAYAVDLATGNPIQALNAETRLSPASVSKLVTAADALHTFSPNGTFTTQLAASQPPSSDGVVHGDLMLVGGADPALDHNQLWTLAAQLKANGVTKVQGGLQVLPQVFPTLPCGTLDRCQALRKTSTSYDAQISSIGVDYGSWCVDVIPTRSGAPALVRSCAGVALPIPVEGSVQTVAANVRASLWMDRRTTNEAGETLVVGGNINEGGPLRYYRSMSDPALGAGQLMQRIIESLGIGFGRSAYVGGTGKPGVLLASWVSEPLRNQLGTMLRYSNNYITDVLTVHSAYANQRPVTSIAEAGQAMADRYFGSTLQGGGPLMASGSGLSPENRLSARDIVGLLEREYRNPRLFPVFYASLVIPEDGASRSLRRNASDDWLQRVAVKTGTLTEPVIVYGLAGYMRKKDGGLIAFATLVNGIEGRQPIAYRSASDAVRQDLQALLDRY